MFFGSFAGIVSLKRNKENGYHKASKLNNLLPTGLTTLYAVNPPLSNIFSADMELYAQTG